ncbi:MAG: sulfatase [Verrucomicrobiaceae bacterium]|nr:sulfatase [Verrucomicrobiaceae bacterium]
MRPLLLLFFLCPLLCAFSAPPNVILILADDLGYADLGCYGNTFNETPHIDRLAREGMRFTQFYAGPVCSPTRCNLQSGQDQARFGITQHIPGHKRPFAKLSDPVVPLQMPLEVETFAECLAKAGYRTGYFGKWHLGGAGFGPEAQGWQVAGEIKGNTQPPAVKGGPPQRTAELLARKAVEFIHAHKSSLFLLQISHAAVHIPLSTTPELKAKYEKKKPVPGYPSHPEYAGLTEELDQSVGHIVEAVERAGIGENTLILFLSDNGGLEHEQSGRVVTSNRPLRGEKGTLYEGGIRIPAIARWPGKVPAGSRCDTPLITMDVLPTLVELGAAAMPKSRPCDGVSLAAVLRNPAATLARDTLHWHLPHYHHSTPASAMRTGDWKLIEFFEDGALELYNLKNDPGEQKNLATMEPARVKAMHAGLQAWRTEVNARMPVPNPRHDPARAMELGKGRRAE